MLSVLIGLAYVGGAAEHPGGGAAGIGIGCVENGRTLMDRRDDRLVGSLLDIRSEEHTSELQSLMRISYADFCLKKNTIKPKTNLLVYMNIYTLRYTISTR